MPSTSEFNGAAEVPAEEGFEFIINENTMTVHFCKTLERITTSANWRARCGWKYGSAAARKIGRPPDDMKDCPRCFKGHTQSNPRDEKASAAAPIADHGGPTLDSQISGVLQRANLSEGMVDEGHIFSHEAYARTECLHNLGLMDDKIAVSPRRLQRCPSRDPRELRRSEGAGPNRFERCNLHTVCSQTLSSDE